MKKIINKIKSDYKELSKPKKAVVIFSVLLIIYAALPLLKSLRCIGAVPPICIGLFFIFCAFNWEKIRHPKTKAGKTAVYFVGSVVALGSAFLIFLSAIMLNAAFKPLPEDTSNPTVVVLGCQIWGERPSRMLRARLDKAAEYLNENTGSMCVVSGGQGDDEEYPEAVVMKNYLIKKGIDEGRIFTEEKSTNTDENLKFSAEIIENENLSKDILIASDRFHQYRSQKVAEKYGLKGYSLGCGTLWYLSMQFWFREMAAIVKVTLAHQI